MEKVKLTKAQAEAVRKARTRFSNEAALIKNFAVYASNGKFTIATSDENISLEMDLDTLIKAIYIGYEVEETPEEKILEQYKSRKPLSFGVEGGIYRDGMKFVLDALDIKIKGIND